MIDINAALGEATKASRFRDAAGLLRWMDDCRIDTALAYNAECLRDPLRGNELALADAATSGGRLKACVGLNPSLMEGCLPGNGDLSDRLRAARPAAARIFPMDNAYPLDEFYARDLLAPLNDLRMPVIIDGAYDNVLLSALPRTAAAFPDARFILLRHGLNRSRTINPLLKYTQNVYFDMSTMVDTGQIEQIVRDFGSGRLLFGSGLPFYEPSGALALLLYADIPDSDRGRIAHGNFERLEKEIRYDV